jgi:hypothetical protein
MSILKSDHLIPRCLVKKIIYKTHTGQMHWTKEAFFPAGIKTGKHRTGYCSTYDRVHWYLYRELWWSLFLRNATPDYFLYEWYWFPPFMEEPFGRFLKTSYTYLRRQLINTILLSIENDRVHQLNLSPPPRPRGGKIPSF